MNQTNLLRPPLPPVPPTWWETHGLWVILGIVAALAAVGVVAWLLQRRGKCAAAETPADRARRELGTPTTRDTTAGLSRASRVLRRYLIDRLGLPRREMVTTEFCGELESRSQLPPELRGRIMQFLREGDALKFSPDTDAAKAAALRFSAVQLVNDTELALTPVESANPGR